MNLKSKNKNKKLMLKGLSDIPVMIPRADGSLTVIGEAKILSGEAGAIMRVDIDNSIAGALITQYLNEGSKAALSINTITINPLPAASSEVTDD